MLDGEAGAEGAAREDGGVYCMFIFDYFQEKWEEETLWVFY